MKNVVKKSWWKIDEKEILKLRKIRQVLNVIENNAWQALNVIENTKRKMFVCYRKQKTNAFIEKTNASKRFKLKIEKVCEVIEDFELKIENFWICVKEYENAKAFCESNLSFYYWSRKIRYRKRILNKRLESSEFDFKKMIKQ